MEIKKPSGMEGFWLNKTVCWEYPKPILLSANQKKPTFPVFWESQRSSHAEGSAGTH
jgi:hypothetical protein